GGGSHTRCRHTHRRTGSPPFAHDGTERRIVRPQDPAEQTECYSGKKKDHTVKNVLLVNALLVILFLSDTYGGRTHDLRIAEATPYPICARISRVPLDNSRYAAMSLSSCSLASQR